MKLRPRYFTQFGCGVAQVLDVESGTAKTVAVFMGNEPNGSNHEREARLFTAHLNAEQETREAVDEVAPKQKPPQ